MTTNKKIIYDFMMLPGIDIQEYIHMPLARDDAPIDSTRFSYKNNELEVHGDIGIKANGNLFYCLNYCLADTAEFCIESNSQGFDSFTACTMETQFKPRFHNGMVTMLRASVTKDNISKQFTLGRYEHIPLLDFQPDENEINTI